MSATKIKIIFGVRDDGSGRNGVSYVSNTFFEKTISELITENGTIIDMTTVMIN